MNHQDMKNIFIEATTPAINTTRIINDGGCADGTKFKLHDYHIGGMSDNLAVWWDEKYNETELTLDSAIEYFNEVYPKK